MQKYVIESSYDRLGYEFIFVHTYHVDRINLYHTKTMNKLNILKLPDLRLKMVVSTQV